MLFEGQVGIQTLGNGAVAPASFGRFGELITGEAVGKYFELAKQGRLFAASMQAGANLGTALTSTAITFTLYNPSASGVLLSLLECAITITTEPTVGAGAKGNLVYAANVDPSAAIPVTNTDLAIRSAILGIGAGSRAKAYSATTLPATPVVVRVHPLALNNQSAVGAAQLAVKDVIDGGLGLAPNTAVTIQNIGTQTQGIVSMLWAEIPIA